MKRIVRLTENDLTRIVKRVLKEQAEKPKTFGRTPFETLRAGGKNWNIYSKNAKGINGPVSGTIAPAVTTSNGEYVIIIDIMFPVGSTQAMYKGELMKTSKAASGPDDIGAWQWRTRIKNNKPSVDTSQAYFTDGSRKIQVDKFFDMLSNNENAAAFMKDIANPLLGLK